MNPHEILTTSMGETAISYFGKENLTRLAVNYTPSSAEAEVYVSLVSESRDSQLRILDRFADVQAMFDGEVDMMIHLVPMESSIFEDAQVKELALLK